MCSANFDPTNHAYSLFAPLGGALLFHAGISIWNAWYPSSAPPILEANQAGQEKIHLIHPKSSTKSQDASENGLQNLSDKAGSAAGAAFGFLWNHLSWGALAATGVAGALGAYYLAKRFSNQSGSNENNNHINIHIHLADLKSIHEKNNGQTVVLQKVN